MIRRTLLPILFLATLSGAAWATPQFARQYDVACSACHTVPPMLNEDGISFQSTGYLTERGTTGRPTIPLAAWITLRHEDRGDGGPSDFFLPKLELISGGRIGGGWSYFVEWRAVSYSLQGDGSLNDRSGRFEDLFAEWRSESNRHGVKIGQYRSIHQLDVSLRLSASEPLLFNNGLRAGSDPDPRVDGLSRFSPASRSPSVGYSFRSIAEERAGDGLFHGVTLPFVGEFSIPLTPDASDNASFELGDLKGVFAETFYRRGLKSIGGHVYYGRDDAWLATVVGSWDWRDLVLQAGLGLDDEEGRGGRGRGHVQAEYFFLGSNRYRSALGLRVENAGGDGLREDYVPYFVVSAPSSRHTFLLQLEYKNRDGTDVFVADLSALF